MPDTSSQQGPFLQTPSQTVGPFFSIGLPWRDGGELVEPRRTHRRIGPDGGRVLDERRASRSADALVEIWQADADGRYRGDFGGGRSRRRRRGPLRVRHRQAGPSAGTGRPGAAPRRLWSSPAACSSAGADADLLPGRGGGERRRSGALRARARTSARRSSRGPGRRRATRFDIRLQGERPDRLLRRLTMFDGALRARRAARRGLRRTAPGSQAMLDAEAALARAEARRRDPGRRPRRRSPTACGPERFDLGDARARRAARRRQPGRAARPRAAPRARRTTRRPTSTGARRARTSSTPRRCSSRAGRSGLILDDLDGGRRRRARAAGRRPPRHADGRRGRCSSRRCRPRSA